MKYLAIIAALSLTACATAPQPKMAQGSGAGVGTGKVAVIKTADGRQNVNIQLEGINLLGR